jgi:hypothetical protein
MMDGPGAGGGRGGGRPQLAQQPGGGLRLPVTGEDALVVAAGTVHGLGGITVGHLGPDAVARGAATLPIQAFLNGAAVPAARHPAAAGEIRPTGTGRVG